VTRYDVIVRGGTVVSPSGLLLADVAIDGGTIVAIGPELEGGGHEEIDARGLHVLSAAIDVHVHFNEPGRTDWEGWATGSAAAAVGGTTTVVEMPLNAHPPTLDGPAFDAKRAAAEASSIVDFALWGGLTPHNLNHLEELAAQGVIGFKAFMSNSGIEDFRAADDATLFEGMQRAASLALPVAVHAENDTITASLAARALAEGRIGMRDYLASRPVIAEVEAVGRALLFAEATGCALHVVHVSTGRGLALIAEARQRGVDVTAETCPHYLLFDEDDVQALGALAKCAPPLRPRGEVEALWSALASGDVQIVASDHSPAPPEMKRGEDFFRVWGGISGCQSLLTALISAGHVERGLPLSLLVSVLADAPARRFQLAGKGRLAPGYDADLALIDLKDRHTLSDGDLRYRHQHSPFAGRTFSGRVRRTIRRGHTVAIDGNVLVATAGGQLLKPAPLATV
jgi:allantoinase